MAINLYLQLDRFVHLKFDEETIDNNALALYATLLVFINRNNWRATAISQHKLMTYTKISKPTFLKARRALIDSGALKMASDPYNRLTPYYVIIRLYREAEIENPGKPHLAMFTPN